MQHLVVATQRHATTTQCNITPQQHVRCAGFFSSCSNEMSHYTHICDGNVELQHAVVENKKKGKKKKKKKKEQPHARW
jgi:hypothetical protein